LNIKSLVKLINKGLFFEKSYLKTIRDFFIRFFLSAALSVGDGNFVSPLISLPCDSILSAVSTRVCFGI
jgi:hypothetical protein